MENLLMDLGFFINREKSVVTPTKQLEFLGFVLDSENMTIYLTQTKIDNTIKLISHLIKQKRIKIRQVAKVIGTCVSNTVGSEYGGNYFRILEIDKINALASNRGNYDAQMKISSGQTRNNMVDYQHEFYF